MSMERTELIRLNREQSVSETDRFTVERYAQFLRHLPSGARDVLDVGCNTGRGGLYMKRNNPELNIVGLDCVPARLEKLDTSIYSATVCGFADDISVPSNSFDAIVAGEIIEHIPGASVLASLHEFFRILRLKGRLLLTTPNPHYLRNRLEGKSVLLDPAHVSQHSIPSIRRKLEDAAFSHIRVFGSGKMTRYLGEYCPLSAVYGSYLVVAMKW
jgi:ubiquinone/menaquinone biosynthesis C-methylase UbiE